MQLSFGADRKLSRGGMSSTGWARPRVRPKELSDATRAQIDFLRPAKAPSLLASSPIFDADGGPLGFLSSAIAVGRHHVGRQYGRLLDATPQTRSSPPLFPHVTCTDVPASVRRRRIAGRFAVAQPSSSASLVQLSVASSVAAPGKVRSEPSSQSASPSQTYDSKISFGRQTFSPSTLHENWYDGQAVEVPQRRLVDVVAAHAGEWEVGFLKVDVEGSELDVFQGLGGLLAEEGCRAIFCEVHFGLLAERGQPYASQEIEKLLAESGLSQQEWLDASHLMALRPEAG